MADKQQQPAQNNPPEQSSPEPELPIGDVEWVQRGQQSDSETGQR